MNPQEKVTLHRCPLTFIHFKHGCHDVGRALEETGIEFDAKKAPLHRPKREEVERISGQRVLPVIEFADGSAYRAESSEMVEEIRAGRLFEHRGGG